MPDRRRPHRCQATHPVLGLQCQQRNGHHQAEHMATRPDAPLTELDDYIRWEDRYA